MKRFIILTIIVIFLAAVPLGTAFADDAFKPSNATTSETVLATVLTIVIAALFIIVYMMLSMRAGTLEDGGSPWPAFVLAAVLAVALRIIIALVYEGFASDIGCFKGWAMAAYEYGPANFYTSGMFADYPPGYMYVLWALGWVRDFFAIDAQGVIFTLIIKLPSVIAEVVTAIIVFKIAQKQMGKTFALLCAAFLLFNPALFFNSSVWGQIDAFFILFAVLTIYYLHKDNPWLGALFFTLSLLIKPQAIMLAPVIGLYYIFALFKKDRFARGVLGMIGGAAITAVVFAALIYPFTGDQPLTWILEKYTGTIVSYPYATINAFNLFALTGGNWVHSETPLWFFNYQTWGIIFILLICVVVVFLQWRSREQGRLFDLAAFLVISVFMLAHSMHERYLLPACVFLLMAYVFTRDTSTLLFAAVFSVSALFNQMVVLYAKTTMTPELPTLIISGINMAVYVVYFLLTVKKLSSSRVLIKSPALNG